MDKRKIIAFGTNSFVISLPKIWIKNNRLNKGDVVNISLEGSDITISASEEKEISEKILINIDKINANKESDIIRTELVTAYLQGNDEIELSGKRLNKSIPEIRKFIMLLPGLEIIELTSNIMKLKNLLNEKDVSLKEIISRIDYMIRSMLDECIKDFTKDLQKTISERDQEINRMIYLSFRVITKSLKNLSFAKNLNLSPLEALVLWQILLRLEKIGDQTKRIARAMKSLSSRDKDTKEAKKILETLRKNYIRVMDAYDKDDKNALLDIATYSKSNIMKELKNMSEKSKSPMMLIVIENFKGMASSIGHIAQSVLRKA